MRGRLLVASLLPLWIVLLLAWAGPVAQAEESVWQVLREPGAVVVLRHSYAPGGFDPPDARLDDCSTQRNLDENGRAQARRIGEAFRASGHRGRRGALQPALPVPRHGPPGLREGGGVGGPAGRPERRGAPPAAAGRHETADRRPPERPAARARDSRERRHRPDRAQHPDGRVRGPAARRQTASHAVAGQLYVD